MRSKLGDVNETCILGLLLSLRLIGGLGVSDRGYSLMAALGSMLVPRGDWIFFKSRFLLGDIVALVEPTC
jgi:hypothetical protein